MFYLDNNNKGAVVKTNKIYNFGAGPAALPQEVVKEAQDGLGCFYGKSVGICEVSHRWPVFEDLLHECSDRAKELANISDDYQILFLHGGASHSFLYWLLIFYQRIE